MIQAMTHLTDTGYDVAVAASRLAGHILETPVRRSRRLDDLVGASVFVKAEGLQLTGSFKVRGALNWFLSGGEQAGDVAGFSAGNHASGLAYAARTFGRKATICMPHQAPAAKKGLAAALGAEIILYDRERDDREQLLADHVARTGASLVHPFEDPDVFVGNGTTGLELLSEAEREGHPLDTMLVPCGGGGLGAGCVLAAAERRASADIVLVEPVGYDDMRLSLESGERVPSPWGGGKGSLSICDALMTPAPGERTFALHSEYKSIGLAVEEAAVRDAMRFAYAEFGLVVEPGGAVGLAAAMSAGSRFEGGNLGIILTGSNVDTESLKSILLP